MVLARLHPLLHPTPWTDLNSVQREFDRLFNPTGTRRTREQAPAEFFVRPEGALLRVRVPGLRSEQLELTVQDDTLVLGAKRETPAQPVLERRFRIGFPIHSEGVDAVLRDGLLEVRLPKRPEHAPRTIEIR
mgnify:CR=1 FL=1